MSDYYDATWTPEEAEEFVKAAKQLEQFRPDAGIDPRKAFLLARWLRSYAEHITTRARAERETPDVDENALELARHIAGESK